MFIHVTVGEGHDLGFSLKPARHWPCCQGSYVPIMLSSI